jgi:Ca-activated chloride channel family protein
MTFDAPVVLFLAPILGGAVWLAAAWARRVRVRRAARWSVDLARTARAAGGGRWTPTALSLAAFCGVLALAGPRWGEERIVTETRGLNLVFALDISRSMLAEDARPSRLGRARREARRLVEDLDGDRLGLIAFAGSSFILAPLTIDGSAITLYLDALDPEVASEGGTDLAPVLRQGRELLGAGPADADRVLVVFTDGEGHDSLPVALAEAQQLGAEGVHLILVAEGGRTPARIPVRDDRGTLQAWQQDDAGAVIQTARRDDVLSSLADAAQGTIVAAELPDQAGAVRDLVAAFKRSRSSEARAQRGRPRAWIPLLAGAVLLLGATMTRRTASLMALALLVGAGAVPAQQPATVSSPARPRSDAEKAWDRGDAPHARLAYLAELAQRRADDTAWFNAGTAALAARDFETARASLARAAASLDPDLRFRALYNLGLLGLRLARADSTHRDGHLADAERAYREALLLRPRHLPSKWNLELAIKRQGGGGGGGTPPPSGGGSPQNRPGPSGGGNDAQRSGGSDLSQSQAEEILRSIGDEELRTRRDKSGRTRRAAPPGVKDW